MLYADSSIFFIFQNERISFLSTLPILINKEFNISPPEVYFLALCRGV